MVHQKFDKLPFQLEDHARKEPRWLTLARRSAFHKYLALAELVPNTQAGGSQSNTSPLSKGCVQEPLFGESFLTFEGSIGSIHDARDSGSSVVVMPIIQAADRFEGYLRWMLAGEPLDVSEPILALNSAFFEKGAFVLIQDKVGTKLPVYLFHNEKPRVEGGWDFGRSVIVTQECSSGLVVEHFPVKFAGPSVSQTQLVVGKGAELTFVLVRDCRRDFDFHAIVVDLEDGGKFTMLNIEVEPKASRSLVVIRSVGMGSQVNLGWATLVGSSGSSSNRIQVQHLGDNTTSRAMLTSVVGGAASVEFYGHVFVAPGTKKVNAYLANRNLLLTRSARIKTEPRLEIHSDDVKCSHGSATGYVDQLALFYMRTRGISEAMARRLFVQGFIAKQLEIIAYEPVREGLRALLDRRITDILEGQMMVSGEA